MKKKKSKKKYDPKARAWSFLHYKEHGNQASLSSFLDKFNSAYAISPCHHEVKDHYHVILLFKGPMSQSSVVRDIVAPLNDPTYIQKVLCLAGLEDYLTHKNESDKIKYDPKKIKYSKNWKLLYNDKKNLSKIKILSDLEFIIVSNKITNYHGLIIYLIHNDLSDYLDFCIDKAYMVDKFLNSRYYAH